MRDRQIRESSGHIFTCRSTAAKIGWSRYRSTSCNYRPTPIAIGAPRSDLRFSRSSIGRTDPVQSSGGYPLTREEARCQAGMKNDNFPLPGAGLTRFTRKGYAIRRCPNSMSHIHSYSHSHSHYVQVKNCEGSTEPTPIWCGTHMYHVVDVCVCACVLVHYVTTFIYIGIGPWWMEIWFFSFTCQP